MEDNLKNRSTTSTTYIMSLTNTLTSASVSIIINKYLNQPACFELDKKKDFNQKFSQPDKDNTTKARAPFTQLTHLLVSFKCID